MNVLSSFGSTQPRSLTAQSTNSIGNVDCLRFIAYDQKS